jgi:hypothetical protein
MEHTGPERSGESSRLDRPPSAPGGGRPVGARPVEPPRGETVKFGEPGAPQPGSASTRSSSVVMGSEPQDMRATPGRSPIRLERGPFSSLILLVVLASGIAAIVWVWSNRHEHSPSLRPVLIAAKNLPAYHALTDSDITIGLEPARSQVNYATLPVVGGLTLRPIEKGQPLTRKAISANVIQLLGSKVAVVGLSISRASALGGTLSNGDQIKFILTSRHGTRNTVKAVVLTVTRHGSKANQDIIVVALQARVAQRYGRLLEAGKFIMIVSAAP